jgi:hypothetical protein
MPDHPDIAIKDHHTGELIRLSPVQLNKLLEIEAANLLEQGGNIRGILHQLLATEISPAAKARIVTCLVSSEATPRRAHRR